MSQLTLGSIPGFFDLADSAIAAGQPLTDDSMLKISHNAKFGTVRSKLIFGILCQRQHGANPDRP